MTESKFTPGPWEWFRSDTVDGWWVRGPSWTYDDNNNVSIDVAADAALIAAAPALMGALTKLVAESARLFREDAPGAFWTYVDVARALLAELDRSGNSEERRCVVCAGKATVVILDADETAAAPQDMCDSCAAGAGGGGYGSGVLLYRITE